MDGSKCLSIKYFYFSLYNGLLCWSNVEKDTLNGSLRIQTKGYLYPVCVKYPRPTPCSVIWSWGRDAPTSHVGWIPALASCKKFVCTTTDSRIPLAFYMTCYFSPFTFWINCLWRHAYRYCFSGFFVACVSTLFVFCFVPGCGEEPRLVGSAVSMRCSAVCWGASHECRSASLSNDSYEMLRGIIPRDIPQQSFLLLHHS